MGAKSTVTLTRKEAEQKYIELFTEMIIKIPMLLNNSDLENKLEEMNNHIHGGEGFDNYIITTDGNPNELSALKAFTREWLEGIL